MVSTSQGPTLAVLPVAKGGAPALSPQVLQPIGWPAPKGYANGMAAGRTPLGNRGGIGWGHHGRFPGDFLEPGRPNPGNNVAILTEGGEPAQPLHRLPSEGGDTGGN